MTQKDKREESKEKRKRKNTILMTYQSSEDHSLNTIRKMSMKRIYRYHKKPTLKPIMRC
jgi:ribosomal protein S8